MASDSPARSLDEIDLSALRFHLLLQKCWWCVSETGEGFLRALFHSRTGWHVTDFSGKAAVTPLDGKVWNVKPGFVRMRVETENVSQDGCLDLCNGNGRCTLGQNSWQCVCQTGWRGPGCNVAMETSCAYNKDNEGDVKSWLVMFGFQLSNIIPGFPRAKMYFVPPPYELSESQASENGQLITGVQQTTERHNQAFLALEGQVISKKLHANIREKAGHWFATTTPIIGKGIMFAIKEGRVTTGVSSIASEDSRKVASVLNNAYYLDKMHYSIEGKDTHYFVKIGSADSDLVTLGTTIGRKVLESGVNMTVSQPTLLVNGRTRRFTNIEFQYSTLLLSIRYGLTPDTLDEEKARVLDQARQRALGMAWAKEQQKARDGREGSRLWTEGEKQQLLGTGRVQGYEGYYVLPVEQYPELADSSSNIQFLRQNEMGKR